MTAQIGADADCEFYNEWREVKMPSSVMAQSIVEQGRNNKWCKTRSIGSLKYKNLKLREKGKKREVVSLRGLLLSS